MELQTKTVGLVPAGRQKRFKKWSLVLKCILVLVMLIKPFSSVVNASSNNHNSYLSRDIVNQFQTGAGMPAGSQAQQCVDKEHSNCNKIKGAISV